MGLFPKEYKTRILRGDDTRKMNDLVSFKTFWKNAVQIAVFTAVPASQHKYGIAATDNNTFAHSLTDAVSTFGIAYAATQESIQLNSANILAIQGQLQMLCQAFGTSQPPQQQPRCPLELMQPRPATRWQQRWRQLWGQWRQWQLKWRRWQL
jgi:hypothetical protein